eukprot:SM000006S19326  [mRNA]  locus=s6:2563:5686:- [translate_table: standard]
MNLYVGLGLLSIGYAVRLGGWLSLAMLVACAAVFCTSAKLLCWSLERLPAGTPHSYASLGRAAYGATGRTVVMVLVMLEFCGGLCMDLVVFWQSLAMLLPPSACLRGHCLSARQAAIAGSLFLVLPVVWIRTLSRLSSVSASGVLGSCLITAVVVAAYAVDPHQRQVDGEACHVHHSLDLPNLPISAGIFIISLSGHAGLPSLRRSMKQPEKFERCINVSFAAMLFLYAVMGGFAYLYFGDGTQVLVTANLNASSSVTGVTLLRLGPVRLTVNTALTLLTALSVFTTIPTLVYVIGELLLELADASHIHQSTSSSAHATELALRTAVIMTAYAIATAAYEYLGNVESIVGGLCSVTVSLLLPALFYLRLYSSRTSPLQRLLLAMLVGMGAIAAVGIVTMNVSRIVWPPL